MEVHDRREEIVRKKWKRKDGVEIWKSQDLFPDLQIQPLVLLFDKKNINSMK
jgi:hypothetical protein